MEDPWANAWGDPSSKSPQVTPPLTWKPPSSNPPLTTNDQEADLAAPSWSTGADIKWDEPSDTTGSLWKRESIANEKWSPITSPYDSIPIGNGSTESHESPLYASQSLPDHSSSPPSQSPSSSQEAASRPPSNTETHVEELAEEEIPSALPSISTEELSEPPSPDAFGTFETAIQPDDVDVDPWTPAQPSFTSTNDAGTDAWGTSAWSAPDSATTVQEDDVQVDEWEAAKQQKEKLDRHVPPELLASILHQLEELSTDLWPDEDAGSPPKISWQGDLTEVLGLSSVVNKLVPEDLTLPAIVQFPQTFTSKRTTDTLRLTRNLPITRGSPMAFYTASKGSTSWEASVKSRPDTTEEDAAPVGWRLLEKKEEEASPVDDGRKKPSGGLFSFFAKKSSIEVSTSARAASPSRASTSSVPRASAAATPRASVDSANSGSKAPSQVAVGAASSASSLKSPTTSSFNSPTTSKSQEHPDIFSPPAASPAQIENPRPETPPAPSAVSRFLGRFSRNRSSTSSPRNSTVALSSDDIEFLSDIVPSASDMDHNDDASLSALTSMIQSSPLPTKLPPPLAPPPKVPPPPSIPRPPKPSGDLDVFSSFFEAPIQSTQSTMAPSPLVPPPSLLLNQTLTPLQTVPPLSNTPSSSSTPVKDDEWPAFDFDVTPSRVAPTVSTNASRGRPTVAPKYPLTPRTQSPPVPPKRAFTAVMSNAPTRKSSPAAIPKLDAFSLSANQPQQPNAPALTTSSSVPFLPPPPSSRIQTPQTPPLATSHNQSPLAEPQPVSAVTSTALDDDEFSDFLSSPAQPAPSNPFGSGFSLTSSDQHTPLTKTEGVSFGSDFDDFDDFVSPPLPTPSPPKPPSKSPLAPNPTLQLTLAASNINAPLPQKPKPPPPRKASRAADHQRTLSLMETAAARGKWPAPPSPLPMPLPPPNVRKQPDSGFDFLSGGSNMQDQQAQAMATLGSLKSSPAHFSNGGSLQPVFPLPHIKETKMAISRSSTPPVQLLPPTSTSSWFQPQSTQKPSTVGAPSSANTGGLSAQDLSFFEGL